MADAQTIDETIVDQLCQPCLKKSFNQAADSFCIVCREFQCKDCSSVHDTHTYMKKHKLVSVSEGQLHVTSTDCDDVNEITFMCTKHNKQFEFYCKQDDALLCSKCAITSHKKCTSIADIESIDGRGGCAKLKNELVGAINTTKQDTELLDDAEERFAADFRSLPDKLKAMKTKVIKIFDDFADALQFDANVYNDNANDDLAKKKAKCEANIKAMKKKVATIDSIMSTGTAAEQFITERKMSDDVQQTVKDTNSLHLDISSTKFCCTFVEHLKKLKSDMLSAIDSEDFQVTLRLHTASSIELITSIDLRQEWGEEEEPAYSGIEILPDSRLVAIDNYNHKCLIYDVNLKLKNSYKLPYNNPCCVAAISDDEVVVTSGGNCRLDFLNVSKTNEIKMKRTCKVNAKYISISLMDDEKCVISTYDNDEHFRIVSMTGVEDDFNVQFPSKTYKPGTNFCTYIRGRNKVVNCDTDEDKIYIYGIESGESVVVKDNLIKSPRGVAVGPYDHLFVCSADTHSLVEMSPGRLVLSSHQIDMNFPVSVAISKDKKLLAVSNLAIGAKKLSLYKIT
ncbi:hypothetical protein ACF0H5_024489 [Mactra antiquata]